MLIDIMNMLPLISVRSIRIYIKQDSFIKVNAGNDEFMMLTNPQFYMDKMSPKTLLRILPNQGHGGVWGGWDAPRQ